MAEYVLFKRKFEKGYSELGTFIRGVEKSELKKHSRSLPSEDSPDFGELYGFADFVYASRAYNPEVDSVTTIPATRIVRGYFGKTKRDRVIDVPVDEKVLIGFEELLFKMLALKSSD